MVDNVVKIIGCIEAVASNKSVQKMVLGTYADGSVRSIPDMLDGEIYSPRQKKELEEKKKKKKKKKHKKNTKLIL